jgi:hypothetical protein
MSPPMNSNEVTTKQQQQKNKDNLQEIRELQQLWKELGISSSSSQVHDDDLIMNHNNIRPQQTSTSITTGTSSVWQPILCLGFGTAVLFNIGILCSLPPVLRGRGTFFISLPIRKICSIRFF